MKAQFSPAPVAPPRATGLPARRWWAPLNPPLRSWKGRRVWIIGASSGIGRATAEALLRQGAHLIVSARNEAALQDFSARQTGQEGATGATILPVALDVTDPASVAAAARTVLAQGPLDLVLYCAGHYRAQRATAFHLPDMLQHLQVNYTGALRVLDAVLPSLLERGSGHISLVSSVAGFRGLPQGLAYGPTKAALINLAETLYLDLRDAGIGVSVINPGFVETPLTQQNAFTMPALITPEQAAGEILRGWADGRFDIHFPKRFTRWLKLLRLLPYRLYFAAVSRVTGL
jgi:NAD(P)-dependent dehydrogenase (short-subunit alcohol dehydrogenase family)